MDLDHATPTSSTTSSPAPDRNSKTNGSVRSIQDILNLDSRSPLTREDEEKDEREEIRRANSAHPDSVVPVREYLNKTVIKNLLEGMKLLIRDR
ncbi:1428_t:CDS:2 [Paraglomus brasilianum]|uniref:1428_t:CDS:1 n=1 Tax=Paraglomus brasilianum TaxID=144538 RepID=A0A9N9GM86_9GLOM|nr:1428_t:CDS:2 [Paraglomus brasilianum]